MNNKNDAQKTSTWLKQVNTITESRPSGTFLAKDKFDRPVILEWKKLTLQSPDFSETMKSFCEIACAAYIPVEVAFLKAHSDQKTYDEYCKPFEAIFKDSSQEAEWYGFKNALKTKDWPKVEAMMPLVLKQIYIMDYSKFGSSPDLHFFVTVKDGETKALLGFIEFFITPAYSFGDIKSPSFAIVPSEQNRGLGKLLMSSILKIVPEKCKRIFLSTRITNEIAQKAYVAWGFTQDYNPIQEPYFKQNPEHWMFFEYKTERHSTLHETAEKLIEVKNENMPKNKTETPKDRLTHKRLKHEPPAVIAERGWHYHHLGIPYTEPRPGETHYEHLKVYVSGFETSPYGIEWMRFEKDCTVPDIVRKVPHVAFEVDNLDEALKGKEILLEPGSPSGGVRSAMIIHNGAPIELIEFKDKFKHVKSI
ncbi:GNAT family N-acetyltransferase [Candidatus Babeliales bacterium]|nr:GNAT family N-acetyltransferase [Candidatus Babeliales bacterium]